MAMFKQGRGPWVDYRKLPGVTEVDFHDSESGPSCLSYEEKMNQAGERALDALKNAREAGFSYIIFTHGSSTSRPGNQTARSEIRHLMRSPASTAFIIKRECIQHESVFVAAIRSRPTGRA